MTRVLVAEKGGNIMMKGFIVCLVACLMVFVSFPVSAQIIVREEILFMEIPTIVAASRYEEKAIEAPSAVTVITEEEIKDFGYQTLAEALRGVVGFYVTYDREYSYVGVRGFNRPGDYGTRVLLMVNGHYYNDDIYGSTYYDSDFGIPLECVKKIEIIRGPGSALYGTGAFFAVVNVVTKPGSDLDGLEIDLVYGTNARNMENLTFGKKQKDGQDMLISGTLFNSEGYKSLYYADFDDPSTNNGWAENCDYERGYKLFSDFRIGDLTFFGGGGSRTKGFPTAAYETIFNDTRASDIDRRSFAELKYEPQVAQDKKMLMRLYYDYYSYTGNYPYDYDPPVTLNRDNSEGNWWGSEVQLNWDVNPRNNLIIGGEYQNHNQVFMENIDVFPYALYFSDDHPYSLWSAYIQESLKGEKGGLILGLRNDSYPVFGNVLSPRLAFVLSPLEDKTAYIKFLFGHAFRAPTPYEKYYNDGGTTSKANLDLKPERIDSYELVFEHIGGVDRYTISVYKNFIGDLISQTTDPSDGLLQFQNIDKTEATGIELSLKRLFGKGSYGYLGYSFCRAKDMSSGAIMSNSPEHIANAGYVFPLPGIKTSIATDLVYLSRRLTVGGNYVNSYILANLNILSRDFFDSEISLKVNNLLDTNYADPASDAHAMDTIVQNGRSYLFKVSRVL